MLGGSIAETTKQYLVKNVLRGKAWPDVKENVCGMKMHAPRKVFHGG